MVPRIPCEQRNGVCRPGRFALRVPAMRYAGVRAENRTLCSKMLLSVAWFQQLGFSKPNFVFVFSRLEGY
jgi:hypothetical protein